jgi:hypothetical protein
MPLVPPGVSADCLALEDEFVRLLLASAAAKVADQEHKRAVEAETPFKPWPADWPMYWEGAGLGAW